jgi:formylglycine-generating enzyme required for sulfatase activity
VKIDLKSDLSRFKGDRLPVENVSWFEAVEFCDRLSVHTGLDYRLPTEAQWEYACRAGTETPFYFGETLSTEVVNYHGNFTYGAGPKGKYLKQTTDVERYPANGWGLYDMYGNVCEWCLDPWHENYEKAPSDDRVWDASNNDSGSKSRLVRGGSWGYFPDDCRSAFRNHDDPALQAMYYGFRVVCLSSRGQS